MSMMPILIVASMLGVKWGWEPVAGGGVEYIVRIEPHAIEALRSGRDIFSDLPPQIQRVRSYRITVSDKPVPHEGELPPAGAVPANTESAGQPNSMAQSVRMPPSGSSTAAKQPLGEPPAASEPFADTPLGEQPPPTFQPPAAPPAAANSDNPNTMRRDGLPRSDGTAGTPPSLATPPGSNPGITNLGPPESGPTDDTSPSDVGPPDNRPIETRPVENAPRGPALQPAANNWPNRPSYGQPPAAAQAAAPTNQPTGFGPPTTAQAPPTNEWFDPPAAGQAPRNGMPARSQSSAGQAPAGQGGYGERDLWGRQTQGSPFSTPAKHTNSATGHNASVQNALVGAEEASLAVAESKPWLLVVTLLVLFASVGLNVYLGMIAWDLYERYRATINQLKTATEARVA